MDPVTPRCDSGINSEPYSLEAEPDILDFRKEYNEPELEVNITYQWVQYTCIGPEEVCPWLTGDLSFFQPFFLFVLYFVEFLLLYYQAD